MPEPAPAACRWRGDVLICRLRVVPRAGRSAFEGLYGDRLKVRVGAPPVDGRANAALIAFIAKEFGVPRARIRLAAGAGSRDKTVEVAAPAKLPPLIRAQMRSPRPE